MNIVTVQPVLLSCPVLKETGLYGSAIYIMVIRYIENGPALLSHPIPCEFSKRCTGEQ